MKSNGCFQRRVCVFGLFGCLIGPPAVEAQSRSTRIEVKGVGGYSGFLDEDTIDHAVIGAAFRFYGSSSFAVEPEFLYMRESAFDQDYVVQANVAWDFGVGRRVQPYAVAGAGILHHRGKVPGALSPSFSSNEFTGGGGAGMRIHFSDRFVLSPEFRLGWEPLVRMTIGFGYEFR